MAVEDGRVGRRGFLKRATAVGLGTIAARGVYEVLDGQDKLPRASAAPAVVRRRQEQYLVEQIEVILDNGRTVAIPPLYNDVFTAKLTSSKPWTTTSELKSAQTRLENALLKVEKPYSATAAGLTMVIGWGLPFFARLPASLQAKLPVDPAYSQQVGSKQYAVLDAIRFPSDPDSVLLEANEVMFKFRSDDPKIVAGAERALFDDPNSGAYVGDLFDLTSKRMGFLGRGFGAAGTMSIGKDLALKANVPGADKIPDRAQLMMGFTSTQTQALGPDNIVSFETLPNMTDQWPSGYFAAGCAMHLSHLFLDIDRWYNSDISKNYSDRVARMFSLRAPATDSSVVTVPNGPNEVSTKDQLLADADTGVIGHNATLQQATRLAANVVDNYGRLRQKGTAIPLREDFNTVDNPFAWSANPLQDRWNPDVGAAGMHFVAFVPASSRFHTARRAMDGILPDGTDLRSRISDENNGINAIIRASHRQNYLIPPRKHRSFPLVELLA
jgi:hypothetical protein